MKKFTGYEKGINLGGWLSQCGNHYTEEHYQTFITKEDLAKIASWGTDHVRMPLDYNVVQTDSGEFIESGFAHVDDCINWCKELNLNVVIDLHKANGFVFDNEDDCAFFTDEKLQDQFIKLWKEIATRYGNESCVSFELLNEITAIWMAEPWNAIIKRTISEIRKIAPTVKIIVGGIFNSSIYGLTKMDAPADENVVFTFHCYSPFIFTHQGASWLSTMPNEFRTVFPKSPAETCADSQKVFGDDFNIEFAGLPDGELNETYFEHLFAPAIAISEKYDVPLYCGEYGVITFADTDSTLRWYKSMHQALINCGMS